MKEVAGSSLGPLLRAIILSLAAMPACAGCTGSQPIRLGFVAQLTGVQAELGVQERNGAQLAVEEINAAGGVAGRKLELEVVDDLGTPDGAQAADRGLVQAGVVAIIGHATSAQTIAGLAVTNAARVVMLSPTATAPELGGRKDYFFRISETLVSRARSLATHVRQGRGLSRLAVAFDEDNAAYSLSYLDAFVAEFRSRGGELGARVGFSSKARPDPEPLLAQLRAGDPDGLLIIASDVDTALIAQRARLAGWSVPLFTTAWAQTETLLQSGGQAVEGMEIEIVTAQDRQAPGYQEWAARYRARFGQDGSFGAMLGYEAAKVLARALDGARGKAEGLPQALAGIKDFRGVTDTFSLDEYGDVVRPDRLGVIRDHAFAGITAAKPAQP